MLITKEQYKEMVKKSNVLANLGPEPGEYKFTLLNTSKETRPGKDTFIVIKLGYRHPELGTNCSYVLKLSLSQEIAFNAITRAHLTQDKILEINRAINWANNDEEVAAFNNIYDFWENKQVMGLVSYNKKGWCQIKFYKIPQTEKIIDVRSDVKEEAKSPLSTDIDIPF